VIDLENAASNKLSRHPPRKKAGNQYSTALAIEPRARGVQDRPVSRTMTAWDVWKNGLSGERHMSWIANALVALVAALHGYFLVLEMFLWTKPLGLKTFCNAPEKAADSAVLAMPVAPAIMKAYR
jgi:Protein of unknown function (DUF1304)